MVAVAWERYIIHWRAFKVERIVLKYIGHREQSFADDLNMRVVKVGRVFSWTVDYLFYSPWILFLVKRDFGNRREPWCLKIIICETKIGCLIHRELWLSFMLFLIFRENCSIEPLVHIALLKRHSRPRTFDTWPRQPWERVLDSQHVGNKIGSRHWSTPVSTVLRKSVRFFIVLLIKKTFQVEIWKMDWTNASSEENGTGLSAGITQKHRKRTLGS